VLVDESFRKNIVFLASSSSGQPAAPIGSGFFVAYGSSESPEDHYLVTAAHVVDAGLVNRSLFVRTNTPAGRKDVQTDPAHWYRSPDTDLAVLPVGAVAGAPPRYLLSPSAPNPNTGSATIVEIDAPALRVGMFVADGRIPTDPNGPPIAEADDIFVPGLFVASPGKTLNQPIVRFGRISLRPREPIPMMFRLPDELSPSHHDADAYLVETRSWGGESGAPVYVTYSSDREPGHLYVTNAMRWALLGVMQGHFDIPRRLHGGPAPLLIDVGVNAGIAIVVPAAKLLELLDHPDLVNRRSKISP
jgi:hypothetical protein